MTSPPRRPPAARWLVWLMVCAYAAVLFRTAWLCDDAFITFRTVENVVNGYGLTWNTGERVQAYTHPLWMFLLCGMRGLGVDPVHSGWFLSIALSLVAVFLVAFRLAESELDASFGLFALTFSRAFMDFSTSGLENPLTHLLLALFLVFLKRPLPVLCGFAAGLLFLTRPDAILLVTPLLSLRLVHLVRARGVRTAFPAFLAGALSVALWEGFSLFYYGSLVPNTAYAKLGGGLSAHMLIPQGFLYLKTAALGDPITPAVILLGILLPLATRRAEDAAVSLGLSLYVLYVLRVGGDFMEGRFLSAPFFFAVATLVGAAQALAARVSSVAVFAAGAGVMALGVFPAKAPPFTGPDYGESLATGTHGIVDERAHFFQHTGLLRANRRIGPHTHPWAAGARDARERHVPLVRSWAIGMLGYYAGPNVRILDLGALGDPLLSRLPIRRDRPSRIGHFERVVPVGYEKSLLTGENRLEDVRLREFYDHVRVVTRGPLLAPGRLTTVWKLNRGVYNSLIDTEKYGAALPRPAVVAWDQLTGSIDEPYEDQVVRGTLVVRGWARIPGEDLEVTGMIDGHVREASSRARVPRGDVELVLPELGDCARAGYEERYEPSAADLGEHTIVVVFRSADGRVREYPPRRFTWRR